MNDSNVYRVYLLRLWQEGDAALDEPAPLRILLEAPHSGERHSFPTLEALLVHLRAEIAGEGSRPASEPRETDR